MMGRESDQLFAAANHYLAEARALLSGNRSLAPVTIGEITRRHRTGPSLSPGELVLAHLGSAAARLATLCEIRHYRLTENYRKFYEKSGERKSNWSWTQIRAEIVASPHEHLHLLLRDNVAHEEPGITNTRRIAADRSAVLKVTTIETCMQALDHIAKRLRTRRCATGKIGNRVNREHG
jgi:hypothetical protein